MGKQKNGGFESAAEMRKQILITQGAMFRSGLVASRATVKNGLQRKSLAGSALKQAGLAALFFLREHPGAASLPGLAPLLIRGASRLWRSAGKKSLMRGLAVATLAAAATAAILFLKKKAPSAEDDDGATGKGGDDGAEAGATGNGGEEADSG